MIMSSNEALLPMEEWEIITPKGKVEKLSLQMKSWKIKKRVSIGVSLLMLLFLGLLIVLDENVSWSQSLFFLYIPIMTLTTFHVPSFLVVSNGLYVDERFYEWERVKSYQISPIKIGDEAYGMFEQSGDYKEIIIHVDKKLHRKQKVYLRDQHVVEQLQKLFKEYHVAQKSKKAS